MRIVCNSIEEFCEELKAYADGHIVENIVRVRVDLEPEQEERVTFRGIFWATALIQHDDGQSLLEFGDGASEEYREQMVTDYQAAIETVAKNESLQIRGGKLELF